MLIQGNQPFQANAPFAVNNPFQNNVVQSKPPVANPPAQPENNLPRFLNYYADYSGCGHWRMIWPEQVMNAIYKLKE